MRAPLLATSLIGLLAAACTYDEPITIVDPATPLTGLTIKDTTFDDVTLVAGREAVAMPGVDSQLWVDDVYEPDEPTITPTALGYQVRVNTRLAYDVHVTTLEGARSTALALAEVRLRRDDHRDPTIRATLVLVAREPGVAEVDSHVLIDGVNERNGGGVTVTVVAP